MRTPAAALGWEFLQRHRGYVGALVLYLFALGMIKPLFLGRDFTVRFDPPDGFAAFAVVPFSFTFLYLIGVFTFGLTGDIAARQSIYPTRMFTLPIKTAALAGWPMLYGCAAMLGLWLAARLLAQWPWGVELPWIWPGLLAATSLAWIQTFMWMPYGVRGIRVIAAVCVLTALDAVVIAAIELDWSELALTAFLAPQIPLAYVFACIAVRRARRGDVPDWSLFRARADAARQSPPFGSIPAAQLWFEWRRQGWTLPSLVALVLPFELGTLFITGFGSTAYVFKVLIAALLTPILMASFTAATVNKANAFARDAYGVSPFMGTKPITTPALIAAKLKMAACSALLAWLVTLAFIAIGYSWSGADAVLREWWSWFVGNAGTPRASVAAAVVLGGLIVSTWLMLVQGMYLGLTGREWLVKTTGLVWLVIFMAIGPAFQAIANNRDAWVWLWDNWRTVLGILAVVKITAAIVVARRLFRSGLFTDRALVAGAAGWTATVFVLYGIFVWWADTPILPRFVYLLAAILAVPLVRVSAAPLALGWNRHR